MDIGTSRYSTPSMLKWWLLFVPFDNYDETDGFKKYDSHIDISHGLKDTWVGKIRDELGVVISN